MSDFAIVVENLRKQYGKPPNAVDALRGVSIALKAGEIYGLLGRNGAGKTTLVRILLDIIRATSGKAEILGQPSTRYSARQSIGYLPEDHRFPDYRTGEGLLHYYASLSGMSATARRTRVPELLKLSGLDHAATRKVRAYSKGMKQRLGLAQALIHDPQVLFLDEPTDGVDPVGRAQIRDLLQELKSRGKTIFLNSHLLSEVERLCDRVGIIEKGTLVRENTVEALTSGGSEFTLVTVPSIDETIKAALMQVAVSIAQTNGDCHLTLRSDEDIDRVIDLLRARQISVRSITNKRSTLEEVFLKAIDVKAGDVLK